MKNRFIVQKNNIYYTIRFLQNSENNSKLKRQKDINLQLWDRKHTSQLKITKITLYTGCPVRYIVPYTGGQRKKNQEENVL